MPVSKTRRTHCQQSAQPQALALGRLLKVWDLLLHTPGCGRPGLAHRRRFACQHGYNHVRHAATKQQLLVTVPQNRLQASSFRLESTCCPVPVVHFARIAHGNLGPRVSRLLNDVTDYRLTLCNAPPALALQCASLTLAELLEQRQVRLITHIDP